MKKISIVLLLGIMLLTACAPEVDSNIAERQVQVTTTVGMITDIVKNVGGDRVEVTGLMGSGVDPHLYKASESDVRALENADIIFYNGLHLEAGMAGVLERMTDSSNVVAVTDNIPRGELSAPEEFEGAYDPHVWFNVEFWMLAVEKVRDSLIETDPESSRYYAENADFYLKELEALNSYILEQTEKVSSEKRTLITAHDAFNYFGAKYGFEVIGLQGISTETEASTADVQDLTEYIIEHEIPAIFIESSVPQRNVEAVQAACKAEGHEVKIGGELFSDAMGNDGTFEGTYIGMVTHNIDTIVSALMEQ